MTGRPRASKAVGTLLAAVMTSGCGGTAPAPSAGEFEGFIPDLRGRRVMVVPGSIPDGCVRRCGPGDHFRASDQEPGSRLDFFG